ncbi:MAG: cysteine synthase family protein [Myxococcota bacterium]
MQYAPLKPRRPLASILDAVGNTPLIRLRSIERSAPHSRIYAKAEFLNPGGSVKDRPALQMVQEAVADGRLTRDRILIDSTSGNTGVAYSLVCAAMGYRCTLVMPANVSQPRKDITRAFGTELVFSSELEGSDGAIMLVRKMVAEEPDRYFFCDQYGNPGNPRAHELGTGPEILRDCPDVTHFVAGVGTTGTVMGTSRALKKYDRRIRCVALHPDDAMHGLEGLKHLASSIVPRIWDAATLDEHLTITTDEGWDMADRLAREEGLMVGHSAGANVAGAVRVARANPGAVVVTVLCDGASRYLPVLRW